MTTRTRITRLSQLTLLGLAGWGLAACGGGNGTATTAATSTSTAIDGLVVKGPVDGAQVCAYTVVNNARGTPLGRCVTTDAQGAYRLDVPAGSGPVWIEAGGGSYVDEATGQPTALPTTTPMTSLVDATGTTASAMVTPLTTLALNTARQLAGPNAPVDQAAMRQAITQVLTKLNLPANLDLLGSRPVVGSNANPYGQALAALSTMVSQGTPLSGILTGSDAGNFTQAFAAATASLQGGAGTGGSSGTGTTTGGGTSGGTSGGTTGGTSGGGAGTATASASGALTIGTGTFTPQATGFEITVDSNMSAEARYRFFRTSQRTVGNAIITDTQELEVVRNRLSGNPQYTYSFRDSTGTLPNAACNSACDVQVSAAAGSSHPVTVTFGASNANEPLRGTLVGDASGAWWSFSDVPATTSGSLTRNGSPVAVRTVQFSSSALSTTASIELGNGAILGITQSGSQPALASYNGNGFEFCLSSCGVTLSTANGVTTIQLQNTVTGTSTFAGTVTLDSTRSTVTSPELGAFIAVRDTLKSVNDVRSISFGAPLSPAPTSGITGIAVTAQGGVVTDVNVSALQAGVGVVRSCSSTMGTFGIGACTGVTVAADGRTISFANTQLYTLGGLGSTPAASASLNGTLTARGR